MSAATSELASRVPDATLEWLLQPDNPAVAVITRRILVGQADDPATRALWSRRNEYEPVATILKAMHEDGSWDTPSRDYQKYGGSLWQLVFLGELWADGTDEPVQRAAEYAFSRQEPDGGWSANPKARYDMPCLTANVGRGLARMGWAADARVIAGLRSIAETYERLGFLGCRDLHPYSLNGYCHMLTPKVLMFLGDVPRELWPDGAEALRDACVEALRDKAIFRSLPKEFAEFQPVVWQASAKERDAVRERFIAAHPVLHYKEKPGWMRFGFPLSYNSDALEALWALMHVGEPPQAEYAEAIELVRGSADDQMRWALRNTFNGKMIGTIERKGKPSKWLTLRALQVLAWAERGGM